MSEKLPDDVMEVDVPMKKSQLSNNILTIQKLGDDELAKLITDLKKDIEQLDFSFTVKKLLGMGVKEDIERNSRYRSYCVLLLDAVKKRT